MASLKTYDMKGAEVGNVELSDNIFASDVKKHLMHRAVVLYLANQRQGTRSNLTRAEVRGGGRKPWRQKGTGRARQGSIRSPQWVGGGVVFAKKPADFSFKMNKKEKRSALKSALSLKLSEDKIKVLEDLHLTEIKTKQVANMLQAFDAKKALIVTAKANEILIKSARNIENVKTSDAQSINVHDILKYEVFFVTKEAIKTIEEVYS